MECSLDKDDSTPSPPSEPTVTAAVVANPVRSCSCVRVGYHSGIVA